MKVTLLFTSKHSTAEIAQYKKWSSNAGHAACEAFGCDASCVMTPFVKKERNVILQIGPIHVAKNSVNKACADRVAELVTEFENCELFLVGEYGKTVNSKADAKGPTAAIMGGCQRFIVVDTARGQGAFDFTAGTVSTILGPELAEHVIKIGWRNAVGRAGPFASRFTAHLVGAYASGANYQSVFTCDKTLSDAGQTPDAITPLDEQKAAEVVQQYIIDMTSSSSRPTSLSHLGLVINLDGNTNNPAKVTREQIEEGYKFILLTLKKWFGVPIKFFESGKPEDWKAQWLTPSFADAQDPLITVVPFE